MKVKNTRKSLKQPGEPLEDIRLKDLTLFGFFECSSIVPDSQLKYAKRFMVKQFSINWSILQFWHQAPEITELGTILQYLVKTII